jgi:hypothetical protein
MVHFPTECKGLIKVAAAGLGMLLIIAPSDGRDKRGDCPRMR